MIRGMWRNCPVCGEGFRPHSRRQITCSLPCSKKRVADINRAKNVTETRKCVECGNEFVAPKFGTQKLCTAVCARIWSGKLTKNRPRETRICRHCKTGFEALVGSRQILCSITCRDAIGADNLDAGAPSPIEQDEVFCAAMEAAGYRKTGPRREPCTLDPIDLTRNYRPVVRQYGWDVTGW